MLKFNRTNINQLIGKVKYCDRQNNNINNNNNNNNIVITNFL